MNFIYAVTFRSFPNLPKIETNRLQSHGIAIIFVRLSCQLFPAVAKRNEKFTRQPPNNVLPTPHPRPSIAMYY